MALKLSQKCAADLCAREIKRLQENGVTEITGDASDLVASVPPIHSNPHDLLVANEPYEPTFVQHGQEPESETVRQQESTLQRVSSTRASATWR